MSAAPTITNPKAITRETRGHRRERDDLYGSPELEAARRRVEGDHRGCDRATRRKHSDTMRRQPGNDRKRGADQRMGERFSQLQRLRIRVPGRSDFTVSCLKGVRAAVSLRSPPNN